MRQNSGTNLLEQGPAPWYSTSGDRNNLLPIVFSFLSLLAVFYTPRHPRMAMADCFQRTVLIWISSFLELMKHFTMQSERTEDRISSCVYHALLELTSCMVLLDSTGAYITPFCQGSVELSQAERSLVAALHLHFRSLISKHLPFVSKQMDFKY